MPEYEAPTNNFEASGSQTSIIESLPSESESLTLSDIDYEFSVGNSASSSSESEIAAHDSGSSGSTGYDKLRIPLQQDLQQLLIKITETDDLASITSIRLRVIARDFSLQRLPLYMPHLTELNLDGSCLMSLRDLGCNLNSLVILRVTRTGLNSLDGLFGLQSLVQLFAGWNSIKDMSSCASIPYLEVLDLGKNAISELNSVSFLMLCTALKHLTLEGNAVAAIQNYRSVINHLLPGLTSLDGIDFPVAVRSIKEQQASPSKIISRFPEIPKSARRFQKDSPDRNLFKSSDRPATTGSFCLSTLSTNDKLKMLPVRPSTARKASPNDFACITNGAELKLRDVRNVFVPSKLTSGKPICGNPALVLLEKRRLMAGKDTNKTSI